MNMNKAKRTSGWIFAIGLLFLGRGLPAQQPPAQDPVAEALFPPDLVMAHQKAIGLDEAQRNFLRSELLKTQTRFTELQWQLQDNMETLVGLLKQNPVDETQALAQLDKVLGSEREIKRAQIALMVRIKNKLTPEQQARLRQLRSESPPH
ncbi:MAG: periplasmic heavy metal sensor [Acidobacteriia bacterium]|nr:periplasmic heavy metal sensor [Terriglobia bacterium]